MIYYQISLSASELSFVLIALLMAKQEVAIHLAPGEASFDPEIDALIGKVSEALGELGRVKATAG